MKKQLPYTNSWITTLKTAILSGLLVSFIMIFLQPFDTFSSNQEFKTLKLLGYSFILVLSIISLHLVENWKYALNQKEWFLIDEIIYNILLILLISIFSFIYHYYVFSGHEISFYFGFQFFLNFVVPFIPILIPFIVFLRFHFGKIEVILPRKVSKKITLIGENKDDALTLYQHHFIFAQSQQNYVSIFFLDSDNTLQNTMLRSTLSNIQTQLPQSLQVHRSYIINPSYIKSLEGNARKRSLILNGHESEIPVSQKYFEAIQKHLQTHP